MRDIVWIHYSAVTETMLSNNSNNIINNNNKFDANAENLWAS